MTKREAAILAELVKYLFTLSFPRDPNRGQLLQYIRSGIHRLAMGYPKQAQDAADEARKLSEIIMDEVEKGDF